MGESINGIPVNGYDLVASVYEFNKIGQVVPPGDQFHADRVGFYTGMQCEELGETIAAISVGQVDMNLRERMGQFAAILKAWGNDFKQGKHYGAVLRADREELLDGAIDVAVVAIGSMCYQTPRFVEAIGAVLRANAEKGVDGVFTHDFNGKIVKPEGWTSPDIAQFVNHHGE